MDDKYNSEISAPNENLDADEKVKVRTKQLKHNLEEWREVLLPINSLLMWERPYDPAVLAGAISIVFLLLWYLEPSLLTTFSILGIIACIVDYLIPTLSASLFDPNKWTGIKQRKFEDICAGIAKTAEQLNYMHSNLTSLKETKPKIYFVVVLSFLVAFAWIGNLMDNLLLTYLIMCTAALLPGLKHRGVLRKGAFSVMAAVGLNKKKS